MSKIVVLATDDIINGQSRVAGEIVIVEDGYSNVKRVVRQLKNVEQENQSRLKRGGLAKLYAILQAQYAEFWTAYQADDQAIKRTEARLNNTKFLLEAINNPQGFIDSVKVKRAKAK